jgi:hypothetical protein
LLLSVFTCTSVTLWWENLRERDQWGDPGLGGRIILGWIFRKWDLGVWPGLVWLRIEIGGEQFSGSIKCGEFLD